MSRGKHPRIKIKQQLSVPVQRADNHEFKLILYINTSDSPHDTMMLDDLVKYLESGINGLRKEAYSLDTALSALIKKCTNILDEQKSETENMLQILHKARDEQVCSLPYPHQ